VADAGNRKKKSMPLKGCDGHLKKKTGKNEPNGGKGVGTVKVGAE